MVLKRNKYIFLLHPHITFEPTESATNHTYSNISTFDPSRYLGLGSILNVSANTLWTIFKRYKQHDLGKFNNEKNE